MGGGVKSLEPWVDEPTRLPNPHRVKIMTKKAINIQVVINTNFVGGTNNYFHAGIAPTKMMNGHADFAEVDTAYQARAARKVGGHGSSAPPEQKSTGDTSAAGNAFSGVRVFRELSEAGNKGACRKRRVHIEADGKSRDLGSKKAAGGWNKQWNSRELTRDTSDSSPVVYQQA